MSLKSSLKTTPVLKVTPKAQIQAHEHTHKQIIIKAGMDFTKPAFIQFDSDNYKKGGWAIELLLANWNIGDDKAIICHADDTALGPYYDSTLQLLHWIQP